MTYSAQAAITGIAAPEASVEAAARARQQQLTKPPGSLGRLEDLACWFAARLRRPVPENPPTEIFVFAADHGVAAQGVSAFPQAVTAQMLANFAGGGAAISVLASLESCRLEVVDVGVASQDAPPPGVRNERIRAGTRDLLLEAAMTPDEVAAALAVGGRCASEAAERGARLLIAGDMGIANTTAAACLICAFTCAAPDHVVGRGTGVDDAGLARKREVVARALARVPCASRGAPAAERAGLSAAAPARGSGAHAADSLPSYAMSSLRDVAPSALAVWSSPSRLAAWSAPEALRLLAELGGLEIAAMAGFYLEAARRGVPVLLDGFISTAAGLAAAAIHGGVLDWMLASHRSAEAGHSIALRALRLEPLLDLGMRLGEGSGAAVSVPLIRAALTLHRRMATFAEAGVSQ